MMKWLLLIYWILKVIAKYNTNSFEIFNFNCQSEFYELSSTSGLKKKEKLERRKYERMKEKKTFRRF